jgi:aminoglycoside 6-adenylyltransferase
MRSEKEMMDLIVAVAEADERIRAAVMVGSRANPNAPKDKYQDYDVTYYVKDVTPFYNNCEWLKEHFGEPLIMQLPEAMALPLLPPEGDGHFTYLVIFQDGNRIDLSFDFRPYVDDGEPAIVLLDKDGSLPQLPAPSDKVWHIQPATAKFYADCCNEFWWCLNNVAKGIARDELPYAMRMFNLYVRDMLDEMLKWYIGIHHGYAVSTGKMGKYFRNYLPPDVYALYTQTYPDADDAHFWRSIYTACDLFHTLALQVAQHMGFTYNQDEEDAMRSYLLAVQHGLNL